MRNIIKIHQAVNAPIANLITYRAMPTQTLEHLDPFLFLNHHGPQTYPPNNQGLPFGPHPHRGFETLTYIIKGDITHQDSSGGSSVIKAGGVQWMTAGSGLIHSEVSSPEFLKHGGEEEVIQLWLNLPARYKMTAPRYIGLAAEEIPKIKNNKVTLHLISGSWGEEQGPVDSLTQLTMTRIDMEPTGEFSVQVPESHNVLFYVVKGKVAVNGQTASMREMVAFDNDAALIEVKALEDTILIFGHGEPFHEPIVAQGPFVMNSAEEIRQAFADYHSGKMGRWKA